MSDTATQTQLEAREKQIADMTLELQEVRKQVTQQEEYLNRARTLLQQRDQRIQDLLSQLTEKEALYQIRHRSRVLGITFSPTGKRALTGHGWLEGENQEHWKGEARLIDLEKGVELYRWPEEGYVRDVAYAPDAKSILTVSTDNGIRIYDIQTAELNKEWKLDHSPNTAVFSPDGTHILTGEKDNTARIYDVQSGQNLKVFNHGGNVHSVMFSPDGQRLVTGSGWQEGENYKGEVRLYEVQNERLVHSWPFDAMILSVSFAPNGRLLMSGGQDSTVRLFSIENGTQIGQLPFEGLIFSQAFSPQGRRIAISTNRQVVLYDLLIRRIQKIWMHRNVVRNVVFSRDGTQILTAGNDGVVRLFAVPEVLPTPQTKPEAAQANPSESSS